MAVPLPERVQTALISGAASGLGTAVAEALHREGFRVVLGATKAEAAGSLAASLDLAGETAVTVTLAPQDPADYRHALARCIERWGGIEVVIHLDQGADCAVVEAGNEVLLPHLRAQRFGRVIEIAAPEHGAKATTRSRAMAKALAADAITYNALLLPETALNCRDEAFVAQLVALLAGVGAQGVSGAVWPITAPPAAASS